MKKKLPLSPIVIYFIVILLVVLFYSLYYLIPTRNEITLLQSDIAINNAEADIYRPYLDNVSEIEDQIAAIEAEIAQLHGEGYVNESNVSLIISKAVQEYKITLNSVSLGETTTIDGHKALPINISMTGSLENVVRFIAHFEQDHVGSYMVRAASIDATGGAAKSSIVLYLCTPNA